MVSNILSDKHLDAVPKLNIFDRFCSDKLIHFTIQSLEGSLNKSYK